MAKTLIPDGIQPHQIAAILRDRDLPVDADTLPTGHPILTSSPT